MTSQILTWTALPNGSTAQGKLIVSAFMAPRLEGDADARLQAFPLFLEWPRTLENISFAIRFGTAEPIRESAGLIRRLTRPELPWWSALFPADTPITSRTRELSRMTAITPHSYSVSKLRDKVKALYLAAATRSATGSRKALLRDASIQCLAGQAARTQETAELIDELERFRQYYVEAQGSTPKAAAVARPDFHQVLSFLSNYPVLMRRVGIVVDLELDVDPASVPSSSAVRIMTEWTSSPTKLLEVWPQTQSTKLALGNTTGPTRYAFVATSGASGDSHAAMLRLGDRNLFDHAGFDVESGVFQLKAFARTLVAQDAAGLDDREDTDPPQLRTVGLTVLRNLRKEYLATRLQQTSALEAELKAHIQKMQSGSATSEWDYVLFMEDVQRGIRVDVQHKNPKGALSWSSLCGRSCTYSAKKLSFKEVDEGFIPLGAVRKDANASNHCIHEALVRWDGWSVVTPRPWVAIGADVQSVEVADTPKIVDVDTRTTGGLPKLRTGSAYRFRIRTVDLAGNSLSRLDADRLVADASIAAHVVGPSVGLERAELLGPPSVYHAPSPENPEDSGKVVDELVLRSEGGPITLPAESRAYCVVPPRVSVPTAEMLGILDHFPNVYREIVKRDLLQRDQRYFEAFTEEILPFINDPDVGSVRFVNVPGEEKHVDIAIPHADDWRQAGPITVQLEEPEKGQTKPVKNDGYLGIYVPKATKTTLRLSSISSPSRAPSLVGNWIEAEIASGRADRDHYVLPESSKSIEIRVVHAVKRPLVQPKPIAPLEARRSPDDTSVTIVGRLRVDRASTARLDFVASWEDCEDPLSSKGQTSRRREEYAFSIDLDALPSTAWVKCGTEQCLEFAGTHELGDTRARLVTYTIHAVTRFGAYFPEITDPAKLRWSSEPQTVQVKSSARPAGLRVKYIVPTFGWSPAEGWELESEAGHVSTYVRSRIGGGLRVYLDRPWHTTGVGEKVAVVLYRDAAPPDEVLPKDVKTLVTHWGGDPIWKPTSNARMNAALEASRFDETKLASPPQLPEATGFQHDLVVYPVNYDSERELWYCDLRIDPRAEYTPFVRLALCRYQPESVGGCHLSTVNTTEWTQLLPPRKSTLTFDLTANPHVIAQVDGVMHETAAHMNEVVFSVLVEDPNRIGDFAWRPSSIPPVALKQNGKNSMKSDQIDLGPVNFKRCRLVLDEREGFTSDAGDVRRTTFMDVFQIDNLRAQASTAESEGTRNG